MRANRLGVHRHDYFVVPTPTLIEDFNSLNKWTVRGCCIEIPLRIYRNFEFSSVLYRSQKRLTNYNATRIGV